MASKHIGSGENRIALDIDGTIFALVYPQLGEWLPGAANFIRTLLANGYEVMLYSTRLSHYEVDEVTPRAERDIADSLNAIRARLAEEGLQDVPLWDKPWKPGAIAYIDDKAVHADGNWRRILKEVAALDHRKRKPKSSMYVPLPHNLSPAGIRRRVNGGTSPASH